MLLLPPLLLPPLLIPLLLLILLLLILLLLILVSMYLSTMEVCLSRAFCISTARSTAEVWRDRDCEFARDLLILYFLLFVRMSFQILIWIKSSSHPIFMLPIPGFRKVCANYGHHRHCSLTDFFDRGVESCVLPVSWDKALLPAGHLLLFVEHKKHDDSSKPGRFSVHLHLPFFVLCDFFNIAASDTLVVWQVAFLVVFLIRRFAHVRCFHDFPAGWLLAFPRLTECLRYVWLEYPTMIRTNSGYIVSLNPSRPLMESRPTQLDTNLRQLRKRCGWRLKKRVPGIGQLDTISIHSANIL